MSLEPLLTASPIIQTHAFAAMAAFFLGAIQFLAPKGTLPHKMIGVIWIVLMSIITITSAFIVHPTAPGDPFWARFSFIHIFTIITAIGIIHGVILLSSKSPAFKHHYKPFLGTFIGGIVIAGALAFLPGRIMHAVVFGG